MFSQVSHPWLKPLQDSAGMAAEWFKARHHISSQQSPTIWFGNPVSLPCWIPELSRSASLPSLWVNDPSLCWSASTAEYSSLSHSPSPDSDCQSLSSSQAIASSHQKTEQDFRITLQSSLQAIILSQVQSVTSFEIWRQTFTSFASSAWTYTITQHKHMMRQVELNSDESSSAILHQPYHQWLEIISNYETISKALTEHQDDSGVAECQTQISGSGCSCFNRQINQLVKGSNSTHKPCQHCHQDL